MTSSIPPNPWFSTINYNPEFFSSNTQTITLEYANKTYLKRVGIATSVASSTSFTGEVAAPSFTSISSGATTFHLDNLPGNNANLIIRNQRTDQNTIYRQLGTTNSHVFQTNGTGTTNLTLSNTLNTFGLPVSINGNLTLSNASPSFRSTDTSDDLSIQGPTGRGIVFYVNGGVTSVNFGSTGIITVPNTLRSVNSGLGTGLTIQNQGSNNGGLILTNDNPNSDIFLRQNSTTRSIIFQNNTSATTMLTLSNTMNTSALPFTFSSSIILQTTAPSNIAGYLGYTVKQNAINVSAIQTGLAYNLNATGLSITPGVYIFNIMVNNSKLLAGAGDINVIQVGISTNIANFVGGATTLVKGQQTYVASAAAQDIIGNGSFTFSVPTTATYYFLQQVSHTFGAVNLIGTVNSYWQYTRVA